MTNPNTNHSFWQKAGLRFNTRFFLAIHIGILLILLGLLLTPCIQALSETTLKEEKAKGLILSLSVCALMFFGLLYSARKGDFTWPRPIKRGKQE